MLNKQHIPTMNNLIKICKGFNIKLSQFFLEIENQTESNSNDEQEILLSIWGSLSDHSKKLAMIYMYGLAHKEVPLFNNGDDTI